MKKTTSFFCFCLALFLGFSANLLGDELTVANGSTTSHYVPITGNYCDVVGTKTQVIYPSSLLSEMEGNEITALKFYSSQSSVSYSGVVIKVRLAEVGVTTLSGFLSPSLTEIYSGSIAITGGVMNFSLANAYKYEGGNLLLETEVITAGGYAFPYFYGITSTSAAYGNKAYYGSPGTASFIPKTTFTHQAPIGSDSCPKPTELSRSNLSSSSVDLSWAAGGSESEWNIQYKASGDADWTTIEGVTENPYTLTGLASETNYQVKVQAICGVDDVSKYSSTISFSTPCGARSLPFVENFSSALSSCWRRVDCESDSKVSSGKFQFVYNTAPPQYLITPELAAAGKKISVEFKYNVASSYWPETFAVGYSTTTNDVSAFTFGSETTATNTSPALTYSTTLPFGVKYVAIKYTSYDKSRLYIDDFTIAVVMDCGQPEDVAASAETNSTAHIAWTARTGVTSYQYCVVARDADPDWSGDLTTATNSVDLTGLAASTDYDFYVRCVCGVDEYSDVSDVCRFSTTAGCPTPSGVSFSNQTHNSATVTWTAGGSEAAWNLRYKAGSGEWTTPVRLTSRTYNLTGLTTGTTYTVEVQADCDGTWVSNTYTPTCPSLGEISKSAMTACGVTLSWSAGGSETGWNVHYKAGDGAYGDPIHVTSPTYTLTGLTTGTTYYYQVQADCGGEWTAEASYTPACPVPGKPTFSNQTYNSVRVSWTAGNCEETWNLRYKKGADDWTVVSDLTSRTYDATDLVACSEYTFQVQAGCEGTWSTASTYTPVCPQPGAITLTNQKYDRVTVGWAAGGTEDAWRLRYKAADGEWIVKEANTASRSGHVITGLTSGMTYTIEVTASCCEGGAARTTTYTPSCAQPGTITLSNKTYNGVTVAWTASGTLDSWNLQYKEAAAEDIPANWTNVVMNTASRSGHTISGLTTDVAYTIRVTAACCTADPRDIDYTPVCAKPISLTISNRYDVSALAMWSSMSAEGAIGYQYSCVLSGNAPEWSATTSSGTTSKTFTGLATGATYTASVRAVYPGPLYSEAKSVDFNTSAQVPGTITIDELTSEGGTFSWAASAYGAETRYQWKTSAAGSAWSEPLPADVRTVTVTGLNPKTDYTFYVRSYYSETVQSVAASKAFTTECGSITVDAEHPWIYGFEDVATGYSVYNIPDCWSKVAYGNYPYVYNYSYRSGSKCLYWYGGTSSSSQYIVLPMFENVNNLTLSFYYKAEEDATTIYGSDYVYAKPEIGYMTDASNTATFVRLGDALPQSESSYALAEQVITGVPDGARIAIRYAGDGSITDKGMMYIDDIEMNVSATCLNPVSPTCTATTSSSATLAWTDYKPATAWQIEYSVNLDFTSPTVVDANANPFTLTGLSPNTKYYARVKTVCAEDDQSDWSTQHASFRTDCGNSLIRDLPWVFDFESDTETGSGNIPFCWKAIQYDFDDAYEGLETYPYVATTGGRSGNFLYFWGGVTGSSEQYVTTPGFEENLNTMVLEFYYKGGTDATSPQFTVGYMTDPEDASTFTALKVLDKAGSYTRATIDLKDAPTTVRTISIKFGGGTYPSAGYIDDIRVTTKTNIFTDVTGDGLWSTARNWTHGAAPSITDDVSVLKPATVDDGHATAKSVVLDQSNGNTGQITIQALKGLEVAGTIQVKGDGGLAPATPADLILESSADGNASLVFDNSNATQARVGFYSKGFIADGVKNYQYIGVPFTTANAAYSYYGSWLYSWSVNKNGVLGWVKVPNGGTVEAWTGYCITQEEPTNYVMEGTLVPTTAHDISVPADENMVVGNSWTAPIDISTFDTETDFENLVGNIYFFNTGVDKDGTAGEAETRYAGGTYVTVPVNTAEYTDDGHINSMQGFFVKSNGAEGVLHLDYDKHVRGTTRGIAGDALHAPRHKTASEEPVVLKVQITGEKYTDRLLLLEREDFTTGFDNGWDGDKWDGNASALYLYTPDSAGTECSVSAVPELEGTVIGFRAGAEDDAYTLSFEYLNSSEPLYLYDTQYKTYTRISTGVTYRFFTGDKDKHERFVIVRKNKEVATGVDEVPSDDVQGTKAKKLLIEDKMYILLNGALYDATGKVVK